MAKFGAIYLSFDEGLIEKVDEISQILIQVGYLFIVRYHRESPWIQLYVEEPENVSDYAYKVSKIFPNRQVMGLAAYTVYDSVSFSHFENGKIVRLLESGFEKKRLWDKIEGNTQPWESQIFGNMKMEIGSVGMVSYHIQKIGQFFQLPGFGIPQQGEPWTKEI
ncbi:hypothetical protein [Mastigocoleus sp. MO_188.B34]|uniref:hypothetical protein n=1 Tax=Mastigocoleus sp. MO_188.B34 TaxID=3036635 RepID=UPI00261701A6|nr:hypothetical protein [Mastigocoleus sp. MO_188.B34]MDJ0694228.1 hypothetical protein [Mastigocoleus sp. MO_188.B34]